MEAQTKDEDKAKKEELLEAKMQMIREKNEKLMKRRQEIEEDRKNANVYSEMAIKKNPELSPSGVRQDSPAGIKSRTTGRGMILQEMRKETLKAKEWEARRKENVRKEEEERKKRSDAPNSASRFLMDDNRVDMSKAAGRNQRSWGGTSFNKVVDRIHRDKEHGGSGRDRGNMEVNMTGRERQEYQQWREERKRIDQERKVRQKREGNWSRAWDKTKVWDATKKMWADENKDDDDSYWGPQRRSENAHSEDWDHSNQRSERRGERRSFGSYGERSRPPGFIQHDDRDQEETSEEWPRLRTEESVALQKDVVEGSQRENWDVVSEEKDASRVTTNPRSEGTKDQTGFNSGGKNFGEQSRQGHAGENESQRGTGGSKTGFASKIPKTFPNQTEAISSENWEVEVEVAVSVDSKREKENNTEISPGLDEGSELPKSSEGELEQDKEGFLEEDTLAGKSECKSEKEEFVVDREESEKFNIVCDKDEKSDKPDLTGKQVDNLCQASCSQGSAESPRIQQAKDTHENAPREEKSCSLPKLITKVEVKEAASTDTEEENENLGDIPPTPDFLKLDKSVNWGDYEIDEDSLLERW